MLVARDEPSFAGGGANELYCKNRRDAIVIFAISHGYTLQKTEEELYRFGEATIS